MTIHLFFIAQPLTCLYRWEKKMKSGFKKILTVAFLFLLLCPAVVPAKEKQKSYKIRYQYNGGCLTICQMIRGENPKTYTVRDRVVLAEPEKEGFRFKGWYSTPDFKKGTRVKKIPKGSTGNRKLYAKFIRYDGTIHFEANGVLEDAPADLYCIRGVTYTLPGADMPVLGSWNTKEDGSGTAFYPGQRVKDLAAGFRTVTLYADAFPPASGSKVADLTRFFVRNGYSKEAAAAIAGNLMFESGGGPDDIRLDAVEHATGRGIGMAQWTNTVDGPRRDRFEKFCADCGAPWPNRNLKVQTMFLLKELNGDYGPIWGFLPRLGYPSNYNMTLEQFRKLKDVASATRVFCACFERPKAADAHLSTRIAYARNAYRYVQ